MFWVLGRQKRCRLAQDHAHEALDDGIESRIHPTCWKTHDVNGCGLGRRSTAQLLRFPDSDSPVSIDRDAPIVPMSASEMFICCHEPWPRMFLRDDDVERRGRVHPVFPPLSPGPVRERT